METLILKIILNFILYYLLLFNNIFNEVIEYLRLKFFANNIIIYEENNKNFISLEYRGIDKNTLIKLCDYLKEMDFYLREPSQYKQVNRIDIFNVPQSFFNDLDEEIIAKKYNL